MRVFTEAEWLGLLFALVMLDALKKSGMMSRLVLFGWRDPSMPPDSSGQPILHARRKTARTTGAVVLREQGRRSQIVRNLAQQLKRSTIDDVRRLSPRWHGTRPCTPNENAFPDFAHKSGIGKPHQNPLGGIA